MYKNSDNVLFFFVFFLFCFISPQLILQKSNDYFQRKVSFSEVPGEGLTFSRVCLCVCVWGGGGVQLLIPY